ncbi:MAG TPA: TonB-dependent receptor [Kofleriaceae bacterium]
MKLVVLGLLVSGVAYADQPAPPPAVDPADLPALPSADEEPSSNATVLAASSASEDVVSGAAKREQSLGNVASAVTVISADRIKRFGYRTIGEAISAVAGVYLENNRLVDSVGIRGINIPGDFNTRLLVLVDGATVNEAWGSFAGVGWDSIVSIDDVARIEVIRGPVSSLYGANAFLGIINIVTRGASESPKAWGRVGVNSIQGPTAAAGFAAGGLRQQIRGSVQIMDRFGESLGIPALDGLYPPGGPQTSADGGHSYNASLVGSYEGFFAQVRAYHNLRDSPFAPYNGDPAVSEPYKLFNTQLLVEGGYTKDLSDRFTIAARAYLNTYRYSDVIHQYGLANFDDQGDATTLGAELRARYEILPKILGITAGTEANYNDTKSTAYEEDDLPDTVTTPKNFNIEGLYAEADAHPTKWFGITGGLRYDRNSVIDTRLSPRGALFLSPSDKYGLKLLYAEGFRNPSAFEAFFSDGVTFGQPKDLHAETIRSFEGVLWAKPVPGLSTRLSGFYWSAQGVVEQLFQEDTGLLVFQNVGKFITEGVEAEASYRDAAGWYAFGGLTYARVGSSDTGDDVQYGHVADAPAITAAFGISTPKLFGIFHLSTELTAIGARPNRVDADGNPTSDSPAWYGWNGTLYVPNVHGFDITAGVRNIIGTRNMVPAPGDYDRTSPETVNVVNIPGEGRELYVKVGYSY